MPGAVVAAPRRECTPMSLLLAGLIIICSAGQISFNKYLITPHRFPFVLPLMLLHMVNSFLMSSLLLVFCPSLFPSLTDSDTKVGIDKDLFLKGIVPVGVLLVGSLILGNLVYLYCSVAFLQMVKESNIVPVYLLSLAFGLERFRMSNLALLVLVVLATSMTVSGELRFSAVGFAVQLGSQMFETTKVVLSNVLLSARGKKLDPLSFVLLMTPVAAALLAVLCAVCRFLPVDTMPLPTWADMKVWWPLLIANACMAFVLNVIHAFFIKMTSGVAFMIVGLVKDAVIVLVSALALGEPVSSLQAQGFGLQLALITVWTLMKTFPEYFEEGVVSGVMALVLRRPAPRQIRKSEARPSTCTYGTAAASSPSATDSSDPEAAPETQRLRAGDPRTL